MDVCYLSTKTRSNIAYAVKNVARHTSKPTIQHMTAIIEVIEVIPHNNADSFCTTR